MEETVFTLKKVNNKQSIFPQKKPITDSHTKALLWAVHTCNAICLHEGKTN